MSRLGAQRIGMEGMEKEVAARVSDYPVLSLRLHNQIVNWLRALWLVD